MIKENLNLIYFLNPQEVLLVIGTEIFHFQQFGVEKIVLKVGVRNPKSKT